MKIGFTGTSRCSLAIPQRLALRRTLVEKADTSFAVMLVASCLLKPQNELHLGDAIHADRECWEIGNRLEILDIKLYRLIGHPPSNPRKRAFCLYDEERDPKPYHERDYDIIAESSEILACPRWHKEELRSGTWTTIRHALLADRPVLIIWPDGSTEKGVDFYSKHGMIAPVVRHLTKARLPLE